MEKTIYWTSKPFLLTVALGLLFVLSVQAQQVSGTVTDATTGDVLIGATVLVKGSLTGTITDIDGKYQVAASQGDEIQFSYTGYVSQTIIVGASNMIDVTMSAGVALSEIVVTGYAAQQKKDLTGSVAVVDSDEISAIPTSNVANQLQGRAAGVAVLADGRPGAPSRVRIRGFSSFQNNDPLYVVDGVPTQDIGSLNPNDIENISVLKDAGAASIYGSRASNGVIVVTTKKGSENVRVSLNSYVGTQLPGDGPPGLLGAQGYADLQWLVYDNDGTSETHPIYGPSSQANPTLPSWAANTGWWDQITNPARLMSHNLSLSGGTENSKYFGSLNFFEQQGIVVETVSRRISARFNSEFTINDRVTVGENLSIAHSSAGQGIGNLNEGSPTLDVLRAQSIIPPVITDPIDGAVHNYQPGDWGGTGIAPRLGNNDNPFAQLTRNKEDYSFNQRVVGNAFVDVKLIEGLNFRTTLGGTYGMFYGINYTEKTYENAENVATSALAEFSGWFGDWVWSNTLTFDTDLGDDHSLLAVAGYESVKYGLGRNQTGNRAGYFSDALSFRSLSNGSTIVNATSGYNTPTTLISYFLRADYAFQDKYLLSGTIRRDGSSRFGEGNRYGTFPSVTAAWRISEESFFGDGGFIDNLKIRGGYGTMGNQLAISPQNAFFLFGGNAGASFYDINGTGTSSVQGFRPERIGNPNAQWETNVTTNVGFDATFANTKFELIFDWYRKKTKDLLFAPELPGTAGAATAPFVNIAEMKNTGIDLQAIYRNQWGDFGLETNLTFTKYKNEIVKIADGFDFFDSGGSRIGSFSRNQVGQPVSAFFGYDVMGLFQSDQEAAEAPTQDGAEAGFFRYADINNDGQISPADRTFIGDPNPDFIYGLNLGLTYKNFDLTAFFFGSQGNDIFNYTKWWIDFWPSFQGQKSVDLLNSWSSTNTSSTTPKASNKSNFSTNTVSNSYYVEDGSYMRLKNLQIGYNLPQSALDNLGFGSVRIYVQAANLFTITGYSGLDPEINTDSGNPQDTNFGEDEGNWPQIKSFLLGLNIDF